MTLLGLIVLVLLLQFGLILSLKRLKFYSYLRFCYTMNKEGHGAANTAAFLDYFFRFQLK